MSLSVLSTAFDGAAATVLDAVMSAKEAYDKEGIREDELAALIADLLLGTDPEYDVFLEWLPKRVFDGKDTGFIGKIFDRVGYFLDDETVEISALTRASNMLEKAEALFIDV
jgi:hypothetical protein